MKSLSGHQSMARYRLAVSGQRDLPAFTAGFKYVLSDVCVD
jgi:hypothetical protein